MTATDPAALLEAAMIPDPVMVPDAGLAAGLGLGELALACEVAGVESLDALTNPGRLPLATQLRLRQAFMWVRVRRLATDPDPAMRELAATRFEDTDSWLPVLPPGDGTANPTIRGEPPRLED